jgi:hypothetical protein
MWRKVLAVVAVGLLVSGLFGDALARKPPRRGKGNPVKWGEPDWGDPDWPAYSKLNPEDEIKQLPIIYGVETIPSDGMATRTTLREPIRHVWWKHRLPSRQFVVRVLVRTIAVRR